jgi:hypothetical protein
MFDHYCVIDIETLRSAEDCRYCGLPLDEWNAPPPGFGACANASGHKTISWNNRPALGLSIGCTWSSLTRETMFFDAHTLEQTMREWVDAQPLLVTFNGFSFDLPLLRGIVRRRAETLPADEATQLTALCDAFKAQCSGLGVYDILQEVWAADPGRKRTHGINGLDALARANGFGGKTGTGAQAPRLWAAGRHAEVVNYCAYDVWLTRLLFEQVCRGEPLQRLDGSRVQLPRPSFTGGA